MAEPSSNRTAARFSGEGGSRRARARKRRAASGAPARAYSRAAWRSRWTTQSSPAQGTSSRCRAATVGPSPASTTASAATLCIPTRSASGIARWTAVAISGWANCNTPSGASARARMRASRSWATASTADSEPSAATPAVMSGVAEVPRTAIAQARRTAAPPSLSSRSIRPLPLTAEAMSRRAGRSSRLPLRPRSRSPAASSTASKGLPSVTAQHSVQNLSSAAPPIASRTMLATASQVNGVREGRMAWRSASLRKGAASRGSSSGR